MLVNQNQAGELLGTTRQYIYKLSKQTPRPPFFIDVIEGVMVDSEHPAFKHLIEKRKSRNLIREHKGASEDLLKLITTMENVLSREFGEDKALEIKGMIIEELRG